MPGRPVCMFCLKTADEGCWSHLWWAWFCLFVLFCLYLTSLTCKIEVITALTVKIKWVNMCEVLNCSRYHRLLLRMSALLSVCLFVLVVFLMMWEDSIISTRSQTSWGELWFTSSQSQPRANLTSEHSPIILLVAQGPFWVWVSEAGWAPPPITARGVLRIHLVSVGWHLQDNSVNSTPRHPGKSTSTTFFFWD